ncbi:peptidoglycan DD-metalloendopeptidase family protein [Marinobacter sp. X15-166B]|uniref:peptidoglycan DD-metalloendopeptidase family protein n=1 Tax=Marinobacter sp. X15-166B TaxID=1897620 RepID=UPI00085C299D|nr:peptidoglycan DD-metalloendopeptidase family protein [Marinobacter sp. X15-166B]OEY67810.1 peptidase M23 [Marinobacter sp. X15-166B]
MRRLPWLIVLAAMLSGCNTPSIYRDDAYNPPVYWGRHVVQSGDTLYSIAWRYGRDYRELGSANGLSPPYHIKAGTVLRLDLRGSAPTRAQTAPRTTPVRQTTAARPVSAPAQSAPASRPAASRRPAKAVPSTPRPQVVSRIEWQWPHVGTVLAGFSTAGKVNKGIDIAGKPGDAIKAAASGNVVYAGNGLLGYGNLVIVNHNEHYLSAYAHNRKILVQEGDNVKAGQVIAELGSSGADKPKLHFEIRKNGNPVNPAHYLPAR